MAAGRPRHVRALADHVGSDVLVIDDVRDAWPALCRVHVGGEWRCVALHVGEIGGSFRRRDRVERRFQNPGKDHPMMSPPGYQPILLGMEYNDDELDILALMRASTRLGKNTRFSLFISTESMELASRCGWAERVSASGEVIRLAHPALLPALVAISETEVRLPEMADRLAHFTLRGSTPTTETSDALSSALTLIEERLLAERVLESYDRRCALCSHQADRAVSIRVSDTTNSCDLTEVSDGIALCNDHCQLFEEHRVHIDPATWSVSLHPDLLNADSLTTLRIVERTADELRLPSERARRPQIAALVRRQDEDALRWSRQS